ncbi:MAG TPA: 16S rRNA (cytidine(1402)-2'-O)-methyltransferase [Candidatus Paceibacterota bacterium]|nr:16S rRNA (cytidine(1402)-2'-O)-methyltransferase [Candidatus Paceibacterota bacterium]
MENNSAEQSGKLSIVATPIGNMGDFSPRAKEILMAADIIVAEDTRTLRSLLPEENIKALLIRSDNITEDKASAKVIDALAEGKHIAVITDAGTPGISDPGYLLVKRVRDAIIANTIPEDTVVEAIPGPSALAAAISISGIPATPFTFYGFPPVKKGRQTFFQTIAELDHTAVLYESPHRFMKTLEELKESFAKAETNGERKIFIGRELTKMFEEGKYGTLADIIAYYETNTDKVRGEFVIIIEGSR